MRYYMIRYETLVGEKSKTTTRECLPFPIGGSYLLTGRFTLTLRRVLWQTRG